MFFVRTRTALRKSVGVPSYLASPITASSVEETRCVFPIFPLFSAGLVAARGEELRRGCKKLLRDVKKKLKALKKMKKEKLEEDPAQQRAYIQNISPLLVSVGDVSSRGVLFTPHL